MVGVMVVTVVFITPDPAAGTVNSCLCQKFLDTHRRVWLSLLWGHCSFLLGPGAHKVLFVLSKSLFPQSFVSSGGFLVGLMATSSKRAYAIPKSTQSPCCSLLLTHTSTGDSQTQFQLRLCGVSGSWHARGLFEPSKCLWQVQGLILKVILSLLLFAGPSPLP